MLLKSDSIPKRKKDVHIITCKSTLFSYIAVNNSMCHAKFARSTETQAKNIYFVSAQAGNVYFVSAQAENISLWLAAWLEITSCDRDSVRSYTQTGNRCALPAPKRSSGSNSNSKFSLRHPCSRRKVPESDARSKEVLAQTPSSLYDIHAPEEEGVGKRCSE